jgi:hypothetical protein
MLAADCVEMHRRMLPVIKPDDNAVENGILTTTRKVVQFASACKHAVKQLE